MKKPISRYNYTSKINYSPSFALKNSVSYVESMWKSYHVILEKTPENGELIIGDYSFALNKRLLKTMNVKAVLTACVGMNIQQQPGIMHKIIPAFDTPSQNIAKYFDDSQTFIDENMKKGSVLVHCAAGISRSSTIVIAYLMKKNRWTLDDAYKYVKNRRKIIMPNCGFMSQLKNFEKQLFYNGPSTSTAKKLF